MSHFGIKGECVISKTLQHFHPLYGLPPYRLHNLFEGIVPEKTRLRLLPVMVGSKVPEGDEIWTILMDLKKTCSWCCPHISRRIPSSCQVTETGGHKCRQADRISSQYVCIQSKGPKSRTAEVPTQEMKTQGRLRGDSHTRNTRLGSCSGRQDILAPTHREAPVKYTHEGRDNETQVKHIRAGTGNHTGNRK